jgi:putative nucleotidyltransferase with HDIG domain
MKLDVAALLDDLPPLAPGVLEVLAQLDAAEVDYAALEAGIRREPALALRVLRLANSAFYGFSGQIGSVREACLVLGTQTVRQVVLAVAVMAQLKPARGTPYDQRRLWQHGIGAAAAAKGIAERHSGVDPALASTTGLLHDLGKLVLNTRFDDLYREVRARRIQDDCSLVEAERAVLGTDHCEVGALAAAHWRLPPAMVAAIRHHHDPDAAAEPLTDVVHVADVVARALDVGDPGDDLVPAIADGAWQRLGLTLDGLAETFPDVDRLRAADLLVDGVEGAADE